TSIDFNSIWTNADGTMPTTLSLSDPLYSWTGWNNGLMVQRINLGPLFVHLILWNYPPSSPTYVQYQVDYQPQTNNVPAAGVNTFFLQNTILSLLNSQTPAARQVDQILNRDATFFY